LLRIRTSPCRRAAVLAALTACVALAATGVAAAHVTVHSDSAPAAGSFTKLVFRVPTEEPSPTVKLQVSFPADAPLAFVSVKPKPGWTVSEQKAALPKPVVTDDGTIDSAVSSLTWTAAPGQGIPPDAFDEFEVSAGPLPRVPSLSFPSVQTYANGDVVRWIEPALPGQPEPDHPAPVLTLGDATVAQQAPRAAPSNGDGSARALGIAGVVLGAGGLLAGGGAWARARRERS